MRTIRAALFTLLVTSVGALALSAVPAGAAGLPSHPFHAHLGTARTGIGDHGPSPVAPISQGYLEVLDNAGNLSLTPGTVPQPVDASGVGSGVTLQLEAPSFPGQIPGIPMTIDISNSTSAPLQVGQLYGTGHAGSVSIMSTNNCSSDTIGDEAVAIVDQLTEVAGTVTSAAVRFECFSAYNIYQGLSGAAAYNFVPTSPHKGYYTYEANGFVAGFGNDSYLNYLGDLSITNLNAPIVGMAQTSDGGGYWLVAADGGIFAFGDAGFYGSAGSLHLNEPIVGMSPTPSGHGYWLVAADGGIFAFGDAGFYGSAGNLRLNQPVVGMAGAPGGGGYWLVAADGGIFAYGDAAFHGSAGSLHLNQPVVGMTATTDGGGYWFVAADGGIFAYGDAGFHGSAGSLTLSQPIVGMATAPGGSGYWLVAADGGVFGYNAPYFGSIPGSGGSVSDVAGLST